MSKALLALTSLTAPATGCRSRGGEASVAFASTLAATPAAPTPSQGAADQAPGPASLPSARWSGVLGVEGQLTGDGRLIDQNALVWENLPLPLRYVPVDTGQHDGAMIVGMIDKVFRDGAEIRGAGYFDLQSEYGPEAVRQVRAQQQDGVSMDLDDVTFEVRVKEELIVQGEAEIAALLDGEEPLPLPEAGPDGRVVVAEIGSDDEIMATTSARIRAATLVSIPAFDTARIAMDESAADQGQLAADQPSSDSSPAADSMTGTMPDGSPCSCSEGDPGYSPECECQQDPAQTTAVTPSTALAAGAAPTAPPARWFARPTLTGPTALVVTPEGRVYGHLAAWGTCHISHAHSGCVNPPNSPSGYAYFHTGLVLTAEDTSVPVGHITLDTVHAGERLTAAAALAHYESTGAVVADVAAGEDAFGIWVAGAMRSSATDEQMRALRSAPLSGDWRRISGSLELVATLAVNVPGFPVPRPRGLVAAGAPQSLMASGMIPPRTVRRPGTRGSLSVDDLRYLKKLAQRERDVEAGIVTAAGALRLRVRASMLAMRAHAPVFSCTTRGE